MRRRSRKSTGPERLGAVNSPGPPSGSKRGDGRPAPARRTAPGCWPASSASTKKASARRAASQQRRSRADGPERLAVGQDARHRATPRAGSALKACPRVTTWDTSGSGTPNRAPLGLEDERAFGRRLDEQYAGAAGAGRTVPGSCGQRLGDELQVEPLLVQQRAAAERGQRVRPAPGAAGRGGAGHVRHLDDRAHAHGQRGADVEHHHHARAAAPASPPSSADRSFTSSTPAQAGLVGVRARRPP